jgi:acyl dehydratase
VITFDAITAGDELPPLSRLITREDVRAYAEAGGDRNPLHLDDEVARAAGFEGVIAHGMFTMGHLSTCLTRWLGDVSPIRAMRVQFRAPVSPGDTIVAGGRVRTVDPGTRTAIVELWVTVEGDGTTTHPIKRGEAELRFPDAGQRGG